MSQKVTVEVISDLSGETGAHSVTFAWGGTDLFEIDLTEAERQAVEAVLPLAQAHKITSKRGPGRPKGSAGKASAPTVAATGAGAGLTKEQRTEVREFCAAAGKPLNARGRLPEVAITAWHESKPEIWTAVA